ncbi:MAG: D-alanine--D-alanine ligase [Alphaproteobacteria bacterium]|nr:D-alanine--D-alanine ligase [Alphaproteobacteria bacterium]
MAKKVLLIYGGFSAEREVSISAKDDIATALKSKGYEVIEHDLTNAWNLVDILRREKPDVVFNGLYGNWGEDGEIQGFLDMLQIPYTHSGMWASLVGMDKQLTKIVAAQNGIKVAHGQLMTYGIYLQNKNFWSRKQHVVKPVADGSSVGVFLVLKPEDIDKVKYADAEQKILVEDYIAGRELTVMCLEGKAYNVTELKASNQFYDYEAKYTAGKTQHILPADIPQKVCDICCNYAETLHKALGCNTVSRCDFRYNEKDGVVLLEINTNPGMTSLSLVPEQAKYVGISYADLCAKLVENASFRQR